MDLSVVWPGTEVVAQLVQNIAVCGRLEAESKARSNSELTPSKQEWDIVIGKLEWLINGCHSEHKAEMTNHRKSNLENIFGFAG
jgi:hypothetical protein